MTLQDRLRGKEIHWLEDVDIKLEAADRIDALEAALRECLGFAQESQEALLVLSITGEIPITEYNRQRDKRQEFIDRLTVALNPPIP